MFHLAGSILQIDSLPTTAEVGQNATIRCVYTTNGASINWSTNALLADISTDQTSISGVGEQANATSTLFLTSVNSGYCGDYICTLSEPECNASIPLTVGKW